MKGYHDVEEFYWPQICISEDELYPYYQWNSDDGTGFASYEKVIRIPSEELEDLKEATGRFLEWQERLRELYKKAK